MNPLDREVAVACDSFQFLAIQDVDVASAILYKFSLCKSPAAAAIVTRLVPRISLKTS